MISIQIKCTRQAVLARGMLEPQILCLGTRKSITEWALADLILTDEEDGGRRGHKDAATSKGMLAATRNWKRQGRDSLPEPAENAQPF